MVEFHADRARAAVEDEIDAAAQIGEHMRGAGRRHMAGAVGRGRDDRSAEGVEQGARDRMRRHAHGDAVEAGEREIGDAAIRLLRQHQRQRSRPERGRELFGGRRETRRRAARGGDVRDMRDQRIERRAALGRVEPGDGLAIAGVGAEPVDGLGRKGDETAGRKAARGRLDRVRDRPSKPVFPARAVIRLSQACV